jgi:hypothetical protein
MSMKFLAAAATAVAMLACTPALADTVTFIPGNDGTGQVFSTNSNDGYAAGRGVMFRATANFLLSDVAIYQNLQGKQLTFSLINATAGGTLVWSGSQMVTTQGLEFIHFAMPTAVTLNAGEMYYLDFAFEGPSLQNFFYNEGETPSYSAAGFDSINGTLDGDTGNTVIPRIELNGEPGGAIPEPASWALLIVGFGGAGAMLRRRRSLGAATAA